jgi:hypothetical protein
LKVLIHAGRDEKQSIAYGAKGKKILGLINKVACK